MKVFVSGGGGFLGLAMVRQLVEAGFEVVSYSRGHYPDLEMPGVTHYQGNLSDYNSLLTAMRGCAAVFHTAAKTGIWGRYRDFYEANVLGTEHVLRACRELGIQYLVFTSTASVIYDGGGGGKNESLP
ncbi:MAG: NAD-dependent epimerase/dehydratase family protein, partial [Phaeodactylibacter sp.]|nr:NAD-dependent epimerase/dehydratase family protein [Phaeodactylibacter sp.]